MSEQIESEIDRLYQAGLDVFTAERNTLAKRAGSDAARVKALAKPALAAWGANQLYWRARPLYDRLVKSAERLRAAHRGALIGRSTNLRDPDDDHDRAMKEALAAAVKFVSDAGHPVTAATQQALSQTLQALPTEAPPGRLTQPLQPAGFEILAGAVPVNLRLVPKAPREDRESTARLKPSVDRPSRQQRDAAKKTAREAGQALDALQRELRGLESKLEKSGKRLAEARDLERQARAQLESAQRDVEKGRDDVEARQREAAELRGRIADAERAVRLADAQLADLERSNTGR